MKIKKEVISAKIVLILAGVVFILALGSAYFSVMKTTSKLPSVPLPLTGSATSTTSGEVSICIDNPPALTDIPDYAMNFGSTFTLQVVASDEDDTSLAYYDNSSLFEINQSGYANFTSTLDQAGTYHILITVEDDSGCLALNSTEAFLLQVSIPTSTGAPPPIKVPLAVALPLEEKIPPREEPSREIIKEEEAEVEEAPAEMITFVVGAPPVPRPREATLVGRAFGEVNKAVVRLAWLWLTLVAVGIGAGTIVLFYQKRSIKRGKGD